MPRSGARLRPQCALNGLRSADFKGQFLTAGQHWSYPLTVMGHASRYLLGRKCLDGPKRMPTQAAFERLLRCYGLPDRLSTDTGVPFASTGCGELSQLSIWWLKLGIVRERISPEIPEQNGGHEHMHRTPKRAMALAAQQPRMEAFRPELSELHEDVPGRRVGLLYRQGQVPLHRSPVPQRTSWLEAVDDGLWHVHLALS
ncbi:hypothetical protein AWV79_17930 [Cupriavidus sp. UYMMa02A]|nr:hypothetical protein AWV79_17930 [Cupriavidus sp. UYMMa02A]